MLPPDPITKVDINSLSALDAYRESLSKVSSAVLHHLHIMAAGNGAGSGWPPLVYMWSADDTKTLLTTTVGLLALRWFLTVTCFKPLARWLQLDQQQVGRLPESCWKVAFYTPAWLYATYLLFVTGHHNYMTDLPSAYSGDRTQVPRDIYMLLLIQMGFYTSAVLTTYLLERKRSDYYIMQAHHGVTIGLLAIALCFRLHAIGLAVLYVHDLSDVLLDLAKVFNYCRTRQGKPFPVCGLLADTLFVAMIVSWAYFRLYLFPTRVMYSACYLIQVVLSPYSKLFLCIAALFHALLVMHIYWFYLALSVLVKVILGQELEDVRDEEELRNQQADVGEQQASLPKGNPEGIHVVARHRGKRAQHEHLNQETVPQAA